MVPRHEHLVEEHLVELRLSGHLDQRPDVDARRFHVDDEIRDAPMPGGVRVRTGETDPPPRVTRVARPYLLSAEQPAVVHGFGASRQRREVAPRSGLAEQLAPDLLGGEDPGKPPPALLVRPVREQGGSGEVDADPVDRLGGASACVLHVEDRDLDGRGAASSVLGRPVDADPASGRQLRLPLPSPGHLLVDRPEGRWVLDVRGEPFAHVGGEGALLLAEAEIH